VKVIAARGWDQHWEAQVSIHQYPGAPSTPKAADGKSTTSQGDILAQGLDEMVDAAEADERQVRTQDI
jgi:hypothetical protein